MTLPPSKYKLAHLMVAPNRQFIYPLQLAEQREGITGSVPINSLTRLKDLLQDDAGRVNFELDFGKDEHEMVIITGRFSVNLRVSCQRCMEPMDLPLSNTINLCVVGESYDQQITDCYEPVVLIENKLSLESMLEDEIMLAMPIAPVHPKANCKINELMDKYKSGKTNPFASLKNLKFNQ